MESTTQPDQDAITRKAYELYVERGREDGHALRDWLDAEFVLSSEHSEGGSVEESHGAPKTDAGDDPVMAASEESFPASDPPSF